jgi:hypothetical protein
VWLRNAAIGLCALAASAVAVSFTAQYRMVYADRRLAVVAGLEAAIRNTAALVFAYLGVAVALQAAGLSGPERWHAHEGRHTAVPIMSNGVPIQEIKRVPRSTC